MVRLGRIARAHGLQLLVLFGSRARGTHRPESDADILAVGGRPGADDLDLIAELSAAMGRDVDLVRFERAGPVLRYHALIEGQLLWGMAKVLQRLKLRALKEWQDSRKLDRAITARLDRIR